MTIDIRKVTVVGTGVLGSQIAFQTAYSGFEVTAYDISEAALVGARERIANLVTTYHDQVQGSVGNAEQAAAGIVFSADLAVAVKDADLVIEAAPEVLGIKRDTYQHLSEVAPDRTIFTTNSSTLLPSDMKDFTGRPDKFLALHFSNQIWVNNTAEIMGTSDTDPEVFRAVADFAAAIGMVPIELHKEKAGYVLNSMLVPLLFSALELGADGYADPATVDKTWRIGTGSPQGPFEILDVIGLNTPYNTFVNGNESEQKVAAWLKENYLDKGKLGVASGEGFYRYSDSSV